MGLSFPKTKLNKNKRKIKQNVVGFFLHDKVTGENIVITINSSFTEDNFAEVTHCQVGMNSGTSPIEEPAFYLRKGRRQGRLIP